MKCACMCMRNHISLRGSDPLDSKTGHYISSTVAYRASFSRHGTATE